MQADSSSVIDGDSESDDFDWEEVALPEPNPENISILPSPEELSAAPSTSTSNIEITIKTKPVKDDSAKKRAAELYAQRVARLNCHKIHTILLIGNAQIRNRWLNDDLLHARLMSLTPIAIQNTFATIHKAHVPDAAKRGRMFENAMTRLVEWWLGYFTVLPEGHVKSRTFEDVQEELLRKTKQLDKKGKGRARDEEEDGDPGEVIRSEKSLMKHAIMRRGSRDTSAQLFTALCRALGIPARLVVSLQSVPWQAGVGKPKTTTKKPKKADTKEKGKQKAQDDDDADMEEVQIPGSSKTDFPGSGQRLDGTVTPTSDKAKGKQKAPPVINLRKSRGRRLGSEPPVKVKKRERTPDPTKTAPVFWTEVFSKPDARWLPIDPIRGFVNKRKTFDPTSVLNSPLGTRVENRMVYVVAFEEDGYARDVTPRYAKEYGAKVVKMQQGGKGKKEWWESVMAMITRPFRLNRDDLEDEELHVNQMTEQMPTTMTGFKNHPLYVLARHLKKDEVIHPLVELGKFRGEPVYSRSSVLSLKTAENWMRQGRKVREGCQPMKWVKQNASTINRRREIELAMDRLAVAGESSSESNVMQGLYSKNQTELFVPPPVVDGVVPKNDFGNVDLYVPTMLPAGAAFIPFKGAAKIARQLGFDFGEAVTGFEFKKRRAFPVIGGIVVAAENEQAVLEAYLAAEQEAEKKRRTKQQEQVIKRWQRLVQGLRIRQRLQEQYADREPVQDQSNDINDVDAVDADEEASQPVQEAGGFINTANDVVQRYILPRNLHVPARSPGPSQETLRPAESTESADADAAGVSATLRMETYDIEETPDMFRSEAPTPGPLIPKTMRELAETMGGVEEEHTEEVEDLAIVVQPTPEPVSTELAINGRRTTRVRTLASSKPKAGNSKTPARRGRKRPLSDAEETADEDTPPGTPAKRTRKKTPATPAPVVKSDRVLRSRKPRNTEQELEDDEAFERAIAE